MNCAFFLGNGRNWRLFSRTRDIIHVFVHNKHEIRTHTDAATSPSIAMYVVSTYCPTENSTEKDAQIAQIKIMAITVPSVKGLICIFLKCSMNYAFSLCNGSDGHLFSHSGDIIHIISLVWLKRLE